MSTEVDYKTPVTCEGRLRVGFQPTSASQPDIHLHLHRTCVAVRCRCECQAALPDGLRSPLPD